MKQEESRSVTHTQAAQYGRIAELGKPYRWRPGQSGNPRGMGAIKPIRDALLRILDDPTKADELAKVVYRMAKKGSLGHLQFIADRTDGPLPRTLEVSGTVTHELTEAEKAEAREVIERLRKFSAGDCDC